MQLLNENYVQQYKEIVKLQQSSQNKENICSSMQKII